MALFVLGLLQTAMMGRPGVLPNSSRAQSLAGPPPKRLASPLPVTGRRKPIHGAAPHPSQNLRKVDAARAAGLLFRARGRVRRHGQ